MRNNVSAPHFSHKVGNMAFELTLVERYSELSQTRVEFRLNSTMNSIVDSLISSRLDPTIVSSDQNHLCHFPAGVVLPPKQAVETTG
jgi:hypothetical protein